MNNKKDIGGATAGDILFWAEQNNQSQCNQHPQKKKVVDENEWIDAVTKLVEAHGGKVVVHIDKYGKWFDIDTKGDEMKDVQLSFLIVELAKKMGIDI